MMPSTNSPALSDVSPKTTPDSVDCRNCGACCASFRVSFYWAEADAIGLPESSLEQITPWHVCMTGTNSALPRCLALTGDGYRIDATHTIAVGDPDGESNARFTVANWCWIVFGVLLWSLVLIGLALPPEASEG